MTEDEYAAIAVASRRAVDSDLRLAANAAGAHDVADVLTLLPRDQIRLNDAGKITNAAELVAAMKTARPHFFTTAGPPPKPAIGMTDAEYATAKAGVIADARTGQRKASDTGELARITAKFAARESRA
jgi:hypothetical protein